VNKKLFTCLLLSIFMLLTISLTGESVSERIRINGFLSQAYVYSSHNDFIPNSSKNGSFEMSEFGLTFSVDITEKLRFGCQFLARDFGPIGNHNVKLDWGFADYKFSNFLGIKAGKIKTPLGLYNEFRDTDALIPMAILPQSIYDESMRPVFIAYNGIGLYGNLDTGSVGDFDYHLFTGTINHPDDAPYINQIQAAVNQGMAELGMSIGQVTMDTELFYGGKIVWNTPLSGLRLGGTYVLTKSVYNSTLYHPLAGALPISGKMEINKTFFLFGELALGNLTLTSEYMELPVNIYLNLFEEDMLLSDEVMQGWYVMAAYTIGDKLTLTALYDRFYADKGDHQGLGAMKMGYPDYFGWQKDLAFGLRFDVNFNWTLKLEWHNFDGLAKSYVFVDLFNTERKWNMLVAKASFNF